MSEYLFVFLYGACTIVGAFLSVFWGMIARKRLKFIAHRWYQDRYFIITTAFSLVSGGQAIIDAARTYGYINWGQAPILNRPEAIFIAIGLVVVLIGFLKLVWLADLEMHPPKYRWLQIIGVLTFVWAIVTFFVIRWAPLAV